MGGAVTTEPGAAAPADAYCRWCGKRAGAASCVGNACRRPLDPPRCCPTCGRRLRVLVIPTGVTASCREHGEVPTA
jgi:hypothetical protein